MIRSTTTGLILAAVVVTAHAQCPVGENPVSVDGVNGIFCVNGDVCVGDYPSAGTCPGAQDSLPDGSHCGKVEATGVAGCLPGPDPADTNAPTICDGTNDWWPVSVQGVGTFCAQWPICVGDFSTGNCPGAQQFLPQGSTCQMVSAGVYGCAAGEDDGDSVDEVDADDDDEDDGNSNVPNCPPGQTPISVEGVEGIFCADDQICVGGFPSGSCPGSQDGLPDGSHCGTISATGVPGCIPGPAPDDEQAPTCDGSTPGWSPVSVEGVGTFCVEDQICVEGHSNGNCPGAQEFLPYGSTCTEVYTGVYGCTPNDGPQLTNAVGANVQATTSAGSSAGTLVAAAVCSIGAALALVASVYIYRRKKLDSREQEGHIKTPNNEEDII